MEKMDVREGESIVGVVAGIVRFVPCEVEAEGVVNGLKVDAEEGCCWPAAG